MDNKTNTTRKVAIYGILGAIALVLNIFDSFISPEMVILPMGTKLGLSNIVIMVAASMSAAGGIYILALKVLFVFITRGATAGLMSLSGGLIATTITIILLKVKSKNLSYLGISVLSAISHNMGQLLCASVMSGTMYLFNYVEYLLIFAIIAGTLTGIVLNIIMPRLFSNSRVPIAR